MALGATGKFPQGKLNERDEGELQFAVGSEKGLVRIDFGKPVAWFALPPETAQQLAMLLLRHAARASGKPMSITIDNPHDLS
jgi:hypothetical protein